MGYKKKQKEWIKKHDVKVGDFVKVLRRFEKDENGEMAGWREDLTKSVGKIWEINNIGSSLLLFDTYYWPYFVLKKITDLKDLAPFYIEIENEEQSRKVQEICFGHGIEWEYSLNKIVNLKSKLIFCYNNKIDSYIIKEKFYKIYDCKKFRQLTYEQILRFEKSCDNCIKWEKENCYNTNECTGHELLLTEQKVNELIDKKIEDQKKIQDKEDEFAADQIIKQMHKIVDKKIEELKQQIIEGLNK